MAETISELVVKISAENAELKKKLDESVKDVDKSFEAIGKSILSAGAAVGVFGELLKGIEFNKAAEQAQVSFEVMLGSAEAAKAMLAELKDFANKTPLEFKDIRDATQTLLQFGVDGNEAVAMVKMLGDVSSGNAEKLKSLSVVMGQIQANGKLMGGDLLQLINAGFNPLKEISEATGESMESLRKKMENGAISSDMITESFKRATSEGGLFYQMLERQAETLAGKQSTLNDAYETFLGALTEAFTGPLKSGITILTDLLNVMSDLPQPVLAGATAFVALSTALGAALAAARALGIGLPAAFGPVGLAIAGATALFTGLAVAISESKTQTENLQLAMQGSTKITADEALKSLKIEQDMIQKRIKELRLGLEEEKSFGNERSALAKSYEEQIKNLTNKLKEIGKLQVEYQKKTAEGMAQESKAAAAAAKAAEEKAERDRKEMEAAKERWGAFVSQYDAMALARAHDAKLAKENAEAEAVATEKKKKSDAEVEAGSNAWRARKKKAAEEELRYNIELADEEYEAKKAILEKEKKDREEAEKERRKMQEETVKIVVGLADQVSALFSTIGGKGGEIMATFASLAGNAIQIIASKGADTQAIFGAIQTAIKLAFEGNEAGAEAFKAKLDEMGKVLLEAIGPALDVIMISLEGMLPILELVGEGMKLLKPYFQALADISAGVNNAMMMLADLISGNKDSLAARWKLFTDGVAATFNGPAGNALRLILGVITGGASELVASALSGGNTLPAHASGTNFAPGGLSLVGEQGPELVMMPRGAQVKTAAETRDIMSGAGGRTISFTFNSPRELSPSEMMERSRESARRLAFEGAF